MNWKMEKTPGGDQVTPVSCGCEVHQRQRRRSSARTSTTMTDLQRRLLAGKAGLLELALLRETQRRLVEEAVRQHRLESSNEEQRESSQHRRFQSTVSDSTDENRSWSAGEDSDEVFFESNLPEFNHRIDRTNGGGGGGGGGDSPTERTRLRCISELHCRSRLISDISSSSSSSDRNNSETTRRHRCRSEGIPDSSDASRTVHLSEAYMSPMMFSGLTYDFPSPLHAVLTQFDLAKTSPAFATAPTDRASENVGHVKTFLGTLEKLASDEQKTTKRLNLSFSVDEEKANSTVNESAEKRPKPKQVCRQSRVVVSEIEAQVSELEGNFRENVNISAFMEDEKSKDIGLRNQLLLGKLAKSDEFSRAELFSRDICHRLNISESDSDNNKLRSQSSDDRTTGTTEEDSPQKSSFSGLLREEGYFSSNDSLTSIAPEPPARKRRKGGGLKATRPLCSEASFSDSLASDSCEDNNNTPREIENGGDRETKTRTLLLLSDFDSDDRTPIFC